MKGKNMKALLIVGLVAMGGCGSGFGGAAAYCRSLGFQPDRVSAAYSVVEAYRQDGATATEVLYFEVATCQFSECATCLTAIVDEVYGL